jgi:6-phosphogluconate dehydrogenase
MKLGFIGLGKMGENMTRRLLLNSHEVVAWDLVEAAVADVQKHGAVGVKSVEEMVKVLPQPRIVWLMIPSGPPVLNTAEKLSSLMSPGDIIIDGGNSLYKDSWTLAQKLKEKNIKFIDVGTSGGVWGLKEGYCLMIGGERETFDYCEPLFSALAPPDGYGYFGEHGAGHYVKMIHNGIEYGMMEAIAEGFEILKASNYNLDLEKIAILWNKNSVIRSWLLELLALTLDEDQDLKDIKGYVSDSGEGRWTIADAIEKNIPAPILTHSLLVRLRSRQDESYAAKILAALRNAFGGHSVKIKDEVNDGSTKPL